MLSLTPSIDLAGRKRTEVVFDKIPELGVDALNIVEVAFGEYTETFGAVAASEQSKSIVHVEGLGLSPVL